MELNYFKDQLFDLINECENFNIAQIITRDRENCFVVEMTDGTAFEVKCEALSGREAQYLRKEL